MDNTPSEATPPASWTPPPDEVRCSAAPADSAGERVDAWLVRAWPDLSRSRIQGLIGQGRLSTPEGLVTHASAKVRAGVVYSLRLPPPAPAAPQAETLALRIVFEDAHLIVIDKAAGMAMHPAAGSLTGTLVNALLAHCADSLSGIGGVARPGIVHRIDKDTTGLVVVAKHDAAHAGLAKQFAKHTIERVYYAVSRGAPQPRSGMLDTQLVRSTEDRRKFIVPRDKDSTAGKRAVTQYWTIETFGQLSGGAAGVGAAALLECRLQTGRTHQIRAHLSHIGCPLVGDPLYGKQRAFKLAGTGPAEEVARGAVEDFARQALHAAVLGFTHPISGEAQRFTSPLPADLEVLLAALRGL